MQSTQDTMNNYTITSPISGTIIEKAAKVGDALSTGSDLCTIYDLSYLEMTINVDELQVSSLSVGQTVQVTADAVQDRTYEGVVTRVSMKGDTSGGTTTYPVTVRIDETDGLRSRGARQLCTGDPGFPQCGQRGPGHGRTGRLCVRQGQAGRQ